MERQRLVRQALGLSVLSICLSGILGGLAVVIGLASGALVLLGFGMDAAIDAVSSAALVWRFRIEAREPHRAERVEAGAETTVGLVLLVMAFYLGANAARALLEGSHAQGTLVGTVLLVASLVALPPLAVAKYRVARSLASGTGSITSRSTVCCPASARPTTGSPRMAQTISRSSSTSSPWPGGWSRPTIKTSCRPSAP